jgi:hypothetical protein
MKPTASPPNRPSKKTKKKPTHSGTAKQADSTPTGGAPNELAASSKAQRQLTKRALENFITGVDAERAAKARASDGAAGINNDRLQEIYRLFLKTPEAQEHRAAVEKANDALSGIDAEWPVVEITIEIPQPFADLFTYIERLNARDAGREPENIATVIERDVVNEMEMRLHWLCVEPQVFNHYRNMFNRFCVAKGWPEFQIKERPKGEEEGGNDGPF